MPQGNHKFADRLSEILKDADSGLPDAVRELVGRNAAESRHRGPRSPWRHGSRILPRPVGTAPSPFRRLTEGAG